MERACQWVSFMRPWLGPKRPFHITIVEIQENVKSFGASLIRWTNQLHQLIHAFAYFLNPKFYFSDSFRVDEEVMAGVITCIDKMTPDPKLRDKVLDELEIYKSAEGRLFSSQLAIDRRGKQQPDL
ncbi:uncharacterized protein LOC131079337 [Cryptomeria japonica]|uniref:uncharacterized protein LOC131079337 n=1 Tax=Cryptomeria japonica TaxID=3369 RepID=UPI0027DA0F0F|nr:uncharacterized protein LOC131079337 [Cryptomeria japonica]